MSNPSGSNRGTLLLLLMAAVLGGCRGSQPHDDAPKLALDAPLPAGFPAATKLRIGDPKVQKQLESSGLVSQLPCAIEWHNVSGGPQTLEAFRAGVLDAGAVGDTPPIHAAFTGVDIKIVAVLLREKANFQLAVAPEVDVDSTADLKGKRIAFAPGQAQGALILRVLQREKLSTDDVQLIELTSSEFKDALGSRQVDVAPLSGPILRRYLKEHRADDAHAIPHGTRDTISFLYVRTAVLQNPDQAAALRAYVRLRTKAQLWASEHAERWTHFYYVKDQGLSVQDARAAVEADIAPRYPADWREVIALTQETIDLLAKSSGRAGFAAERLFDLRFQSVGAEIANPSTAAAELGGATFTAGAGRP